MSSGPAQSGRHSEDEQILHRLGYAQELFRAMGGFQNFAISFTIISILAGCLTSYFIAFNNGGPFDPATYGGNADTAKAVRQAFLKTIPRQQIVDRVDGKAAGVEHAFGVSPRYEDMHWEGLDLPRANFEQLMAIDTDEWREEIRSHGKLLSRLAGRLPHQLEQTKRALAQRLTD